MWFRVMFLALCYLLASGVSAAEKSARDAYDQLNALRVDAATLYDVDPANRIELLRGDVQFSFEQGKLAFLQMYDRRLTGVGFRGRLHALPPPRDLAPKHQIAHLLRAPVLDHASTSACLRFA